MTLDRIDEFMLEKDESILVDDFIGHLPLLFLVLCFLLFFDLFFDLGAMK